MFIELVHEDDTKIWLNFDLVEFFIEGEGGEFTEITMEGGGAILVKDSPMAIARVLARFSK